jgi:oligopeptide transport system substrate-binding protein
MKYFLCLNFYFSFLFAALLLVVSCDKSQVSGLGKDNPFGGTLTLVRANVQITTLPMATNDDESSFIIDQIYDRLFKTKDNSNDIVPHLVNNYVVTNEGRTYTFELRKGVYFRDDPCYPNGKGKELSSQDVKFTLELLCTKSPINKSFEYTLKDLIVGANDYYNKSDKNNQQELSGLKIIDKYKFSVELEHPTTKFLQILSSYALSIISKEAFIKYGVNNSNGTGPFILDKKINKGKTILTKNPNYFLMDTLGHKLPYIDSVIIIRTNKIEDGLTLFKKGVADVVVNVPAKDIKQIIENEIQFFENKEEKAKYKVDFEANLSTRILLFNVTKAPLDNKLVRKALNYALDKDKILQLSGTALSAGPAYSSFVPPVMAKMGYIAPDNMNYKYNLSLAKKYLAEAGYPEGKNFPTINLVIPSQEDALKLALEIQKQLLQNLSIKLSFEIVNDYSKFESLIYKGDYQIVNFFWIADYPSPESFLNLFYYDDLHNEHNFGNYNNTTFNTYFYKAKKSSNLDSMMYYFSNAESVLMDDVPMQLLYYGSSFRLMKTRVLNFESPPLGSIDLSKVKISKN